MVALPSTGLKCLKMYRYSFLKYQRMSPFLIVRLNFSFERRTDIYPKLVVYLPSLFRESLVQALISTLNKYEKKYFGQLIYQYGAEKDDEIDEIFRRLRRLEIRSDTDIRKTAAELHKFMHDKATCLSTQIKIKQLLQVVDALEGFHAAILRM